ncbi:hypothetical protein [Nocardioides antri]|uniref:Uncharacterized protein n=1 Tax=Nocardioides antri TaxID=2607659 RepID=A0A5B1LZY5_9ACTN|nr:hypothetical protein [Nocardioides antri]KAA1426475.1 hypothetical protein F0U47_13820 [Nocardioides antri]
MAEDLAVVAEQLVVGMVTLRLSADALGVQRDRVDQDADAALWRQVHDELGIDARRDALVWQLVQVCEELVSFASDRTRSTPEAVVAEVARRLRERRGAGLE